MKGKFKKLVVFTLGVAVICMMTVLTFALSGHVSVYVGAVWGIASMLAAIPFHILGKKAKAFYFVSIFLNLLGSSLFCAVYYTETDRQPTLATLFLGSLCAIFLLSLTYALVHVFPRFSAAVGAIGVVLCIGSGIYNVVRWIQTGNAVYSFGFFALTVSVMYLLAMLCVTETPATRATRYASFAGFGIFIIIATVVLFILSEGDLLEGVFEGGAEAISEKVKKRKTKK